MPVNDQLQNALASAINKTVGGVGAGVTFLQGQLPDVIRQLLLWRTVSSLVSMVITLASMYALFRVSRYGYKRIAAMSTAEPDRYRANRILNLRIWLGAATALLTILFLTNLYVDFDWLQILIAPKFYLVQYAASLAK